MVGWNFAARGFALFDGQILSISQNTALFSLLGTFYGGDGRTTFALPDLRGRVPMHMGNGPGLTDRRIGERSGVETVTLTINQIPQHNHNPRLQAENIAGNTDDPTGNMLAKAPKSYRPQFRSNDVAMNSAAVVSNDVGGGQSHNNMQPYLVMNYQMALVGLFPSRN